MHVYTKEQKEFLFNNVAGRGNKEIVIMFNEKFNLNLTVRQISNFKKNNKVKSGLDGRFNKGRDPWNKGLKGIIIGGVETQFKKGNRPYNYKPVGSQRITKDGYIEIKIEDPKKWRLKHILIWEQHNGPLPKGHAVIFGDGNNRNFDINNLLLVSRAQLLYLNRNGLIKNNVEITKVGVVLADLDKKLNQRKKDE